MGSHRIIPRSEWGAGDCHSSGPAPVDRPELWLHHTVTPAWTGMDAPRKVQEVSFDRGFSDISYTFVVTVDGEIFEGRPLDRVGGHTYGRNTVSHAICAIGNFEENDPPRPMLEAVQWLVGYGVAKGWWPGLTGGHRDVKATACPGRRLYEEIPALKAGRYFPPPPQPEEQEYDVTQHEINQIISGVMTAMVNQKQSLRSILREEDRQSDAIIQKLDRIIQMLGSR